MSFFFTREKGPSLFLGPSGVLWLLRIPWRLSLEVAKDTLLLLGWDLAVSRFVIITEIIEESQTPSRR